MNTSQLHLARQKFFEWVASTDVAEQCGLTREEMVDSVKFNVPPLIIRGGDGGTQPGERGGDVYVTMTRQPDGPPSPDGPNASFTVADMKDAITEALDSDGSLGGQDEWSAARTAGTEPPFRDERGQS